MRSAPGDAVKSCRQGRRWSRMPSPVPDGIIYRYAINSRRRRARAKGSSRTPPDEGRPRSVPRHRASPMKATAIIGVHAANESQWVRDRPLRRRLHFGRKPATGLFRSLSMTASTIDDNARQPWRWRPGVARLAIDVLSSTSTRLRQALSARTRPRGAAQVRGHRDHFGTNEQYASRAGRAGRLAIAARRS